MNDKEKSSIWLSPNSDIYFGKAEKGKQNRVQLNFKSRSENVALARLLVAAILSERDMTLAELDEIKVAVSEAVSNAIIHGYQNDSEGWVEMSVELAEDQMIIIVHDEGIGIENIEEAMKPHFSKGEERMGLGFAFMNSFVDKVEVASIPLSGTTVTLTKKLS
jgi:stage II sporulation protein AB (anti-sigma F factor)